MNDSNLTPFGSLLAKAKAGQASAIGRLLEPYRSYLRRLVSRCLPSRLRPKADPSGVVQDCLHTAGRQLGKCRATEARGFRAWLHGIMKNLIRKDIRVEGKRGEREVPLPVGSDGQVQVAADQTPLLDRAVRDEEVRDLQRALGEFGPYEGEILRLRFFEDLSYEDIAQCLGHGTTREELAKVRQRVHRLLGKLRVGMALLAATRLMSPLDQKVLCLRYFRGESPEEIAQALGHEPGAVRRVLAEAKRQLLPDLGEHL